MILAEEPHFFEPGEFPKTVRVYRALNNEFVDRKVKMNSSGGEIVTITVPQDDEVRYSTDGCDPGKTMKTVTGRVSIFVRKIKKEKHP